MKSTNPYAARVVAEIDIHQAVAAVEHFADNYPDDRQSIVIFNRLFTAAEKIFDKVANAPKRAAELSGLFAASVLGKEDAFWNNAYRSMMSTIPFAYTNGPAPPTDSQVVFNLGGCVSGRFDSTKENHGNTPQEEVPKIVRELGECFGTPSSKAPHDISHLCKECLVWSNDNGPERHRKNCSKFGAELKGKS